MLSSLTTKAFPLYSCATYNVQGVFFPFLVLQIKSFNSKKGICNGLIFICMNFQFLVFEHLRFHILTFCTLLVATLWQKLMGEYVIISTKLCGHVFWPSGPTSVTLPQSCSGQNMRGHVCKTVHWSTDYNCKRGKQSTCPQ